MIASAILLFVAAAQPAASTDPHYAVRFDLKPPPFGSQVLGIAALSPAHQLVGQGPPYRFVN
jgi:hypothetical protein